MATKLSKVLENIEHKIPFLRNLFKSKREIHKKRYPNNLVKKIFLPNFSETKWVDEYLGVDIFAKEALEDFLNDPEYSRSKANILKAYEIAEPRETICFFSINNCGASIKKSKFPTYIENDLLATEIYKFFIRNPGTHSTAKIAKDINENIYKQRLKTDPNAQYEEVFTYWQINYFVTIKCFVNEIMKFRVEKSKGVSLVWVNPIYEDFLPKTNEDYELASMKEKQRLTFVKNIFHPLKYPNKRQFIEYKTVQDQMMANKLPFEVCNFPTIKEYELTNPENYKLFLYGLVRENKYETIQKYAKELEDIGTTIIEVFEKGFTKLSHQLKYLKDFAEKLNTT